jgi:CRISPR-associated protein Cas5 subtype I-A
MRGVNVRRLFLVLSLLICFSVPVSAETLGNEVIFSRFGTYFDIPTFDLVLDSADNFFTARNINIRPTKSNFLWLGLSYLGLNDEDAVKEKDFLSKTYDYIYAPNEEFEDVKAEVVIEKEQEVINTYINQKIIDEKASRKGMVGRWYIPAVNIDVAVFNSSSQQTADNMDSAVYFKFGDFMVLGDHVNQGFDRIKKCQVGTKAYLDTGNERKEYVCTKYFTGHNQVDDMTDDNYKSVKYGANTGGIPCYTCHDNWKNIWIVFFQPVNS